MIRKYVFAGLEHVSSNLTSLKKVPRVIMNLGSIILINTVLIKFSKFTNNLLVQSLEKSETPKTFEGKNCPKKVLVRTVF